MPQTDYETMWNSVWESVRNYNNVDADQVNAFFSRLVPQAFSEGFLMLTASTEFIKKWVETNYIHLIKQALEEQYQVPFNVAIEVDSSSPYIPTITQAPHTPAEMQPEETHIQEETTSQNTYQSPQTLNTQAGLISEYSFDNFVVGSSNKIAYSMALSVAENPGQSLLNPLFLYGKSGLGKTHLLRAIQNYVTQNYPHYNTIYTDTNELVNDYTEASRSGDFHSFNKPYDNADMILIDDVQYLEGRPGTIDLVFQKLNSMTARGKQVVFAADRAPKNIDLNERIISRFSSGGLQDIQPPEVETKLGIIRNYISMLQEKGELLIPLSDAVQMYIAQNSSSNVRELKGAITKISYYIKELEKTDISVEEVADLLKNHFRGGLLKPHTVAEIQSAVEKYYSISHADLIGRKRSANIAHARHMAVYLCRNMIDIPYSSIGKAFNRDHTSIMYGATQIEEKLKESHELREEVEVIKQLINEQRDI